MLDWDDEELASILWDEAPETVVSYQEGPEGSHSAAPRKELKLGKELVSDEHEIKRASDKAGIDGLGIESNSACNSKTKKFLSCFGDESWKDINFSTAVKKSNDSIGSNHASLPCSSQNLLSSGDGAARFDKDSESSQKQQEEHLKGNFVDYIWDDIGSFDEIEKIFSNGDATFGNIGLGSVDELWSASLDAAYSQDKPFPSPVESLTPCPESSNNAHIQNKVRTEFTHQSNQPISDHDNARDCMPYEYSSMVVPTDGATNLKVLEIELDQLEKDPTLSSPNSSCSTLNKLSNKLSKPKKLKNRKGSDHKMKGKSLLSPYGSHFLPKNQLQQFGKQDATSMIHSYPYSEHTQQNTHHRSNKISVPCENMYQHHAVPIMPQHHHAAGSFQHKLPAYEASHGSSHLKTIHSPLKPLFMTPQEKIDKLRRRQQMQAMLAIKKQQHQLGHKDGTEKNIKETHIIHPFSEPGWSSPKEIPTKVCKAVNEFPVENSTLSQIQDIIAKLDSRVRLCIRDSLFRLATSAAQRHYPADNLSANDNARDEDNKFVSDEISNHNRNVIMVDTEAETNPIDRTVAHLLFHRPFDVTAKSTEAPNLSLSTQPLPVFKSEYLVDTPNECSKDTAEPKQSLFQKESESSFPATEPQFGSELLNSSHLDVSEKTSSHEPSTEM